MRIQEYYIWPGMRKHVKEYLATCPQCTLVQPKPNTGVKGKIPTPPRPFHTWGIDLVGPFPRDKKGRQYLLTCVDHLTGWVEAFPIRTKGSVGVTETFLEQIVARYGTPSVLITDNGGEFTSKAFENWMREMGIEHHLTSPYHPQSNGKCERMNGTLQKVIKRLSQGKPNKWSIYLPDALLAIRTNPSQEGPTPYETLYGQKPRVPRVNMSPEVPGERLRNMVKARAIISKGQEARKDKYQDTTREPTELKVGDLVSLKVLAPKKGQLEWDPGYTILHIHSNGALLIQGSDARELRVNRDRVRLTPAPVCYEEVDPLPQVKKLPMSQLPEEARQVVPLPDVDQPPIARAAVTQRHTSQGRDWEDWCNTVKCFMAKTASRAVPIVTPVSNTSVPVC